MIKTFHCYFLDTLYLPALDISKYVYGIIHYHQYVVYKSPNFKDRRYLILAISALAIVITNATKVMALKVVGDTMTLSGKCDNGGKLEDLSCHVSGTLQGHMVCETAGGYAD